MALKTIIYPIRAVAGMSFAFLTTYPTSVIDETIVPGTKTVLIVLVPGIFINILVDGFFSSRIEVDNHSYKQ